MCPVLREVAGCCTSPAGDPRCRRSLSAFPFPNCAGRVRPAFLAGMEGERGPVRNPRPDPVERAGACAPSGSHSDGYRLATSDGAVFDFGKPLLLRWLEHRRAALQCRFDGHPLRTAAVTGSCSRTAPCTPSATPSGMETSVAVAGVAGRCRPGLRLSASPRHPTRRATSSRRPTVPSTRSVMPSTSGSRGGLCTAGAVVAIAVDPLTGGYWLATSKGAVYPEGDVTFDGSASGSPELSDRCHGCSAGRSRVLAGGQNGDVYPSA